MDIAGPVERTAVIVRVPAPEFKVRRPSTCTCAVEPVEMLWLKESELPAATSMRPFMVNDAGSAMLLLPVEFSSVPPRRW